MEVPKIVVEAMSAEESKCGYTTSGQSDFELVVCFKEAFLQRVL